MKFIDGLSPWIAVGTRVTINSIDMDRKYAYTFRFAAVAPPKSPVLTAKATAIAESKAFQSVTGTDNADDARERMFFFGEPPEDKSMTESYECHSDRDPVTREKQVQIIDEFVRQHGGEYSVESNTWTIPPSSELPGRIIRIIEPQGDGDIEMQIASGTENVRVNVVKIEKSEGRTVITTGPVLRVPDAPFIRITGEGKAAEALDRMYPTTTAIP